MIRHTLGRNASDRIGSDRSDHYTTLESEARPRLLSDEKYLHVQSIIDENGLESDGAEEDEISDRSNHFVFSTVKGLNKDADTSLDQNLLHRKLQEKKQLHQKQSTLLLTSPYKAEEIKEVQAVTVLDCQLGRVDHLRMESEADSNNHLDSQDFVLNNSSYI
jgi:hypothetical protein